MGELQRKNSAAVVYYSSPLLEGLGVPHAFSTRCGGVSVAPFDSLNLGNPSDSPVRDAVWNIHENYRRLQAAIGCQERSLCQVHQVHGAAMADLCRGRASDSSVRADALLSDDPGRMVSVRVADCVPILLADEEGRWVAAVHAGWRGVVANVVGATVAALSRAIGPKAPGNLAAAVGPCIGAEAFEVGPEVLERFGKSPSLPGGKGTVDLRRRVYEQLREAGIQAERIDTTDRCTARDAEEFFSHRRERGVTGRLAALIGPRA